MSEKAADPVPVEPLESEAIDPAEQEAPALTLAELTQEVQALKGRVNEIEESDATKMPRELLDQELEAIKAQIARIDEDMTRVMSQGRNIAEVRELAQTWVSDMRKAAERQKGSELAVKHALAAAEKDRKKLARTLDQVLKAVKARK